MRTRNVHRLAAVDQAVVVGQREIHHRADHDLAVAHHRAVLDAVQAENADCGGLMIGVDISEPNTPPLEMVKVPPFMSSIVSVPSRARLPKSAIVLLDLGEAHAVGIAHHRHDQAVARRRPRRRCR